MNLPSPDKAGGCAGRPGRGARAIAVLFLAGLLLGLPAQAQERRRIAPEIPRCANPYSQRIDCSDGVIRPETTGPGGGIVIRRPGAPMPLPAMPGAPPTMQNEIRGFSR